VSGPALRGELGPGTVHLCIDMQRVFAERTPWQTPWMPRVLPQALQLVRAHAAATVFTRFMPPRRPEERPGQWRRYFERWRELTLEPAGTALFDLVPELAACVPPAVVVDKPAYSPFHGTQLAAWLRTRGVDGIVVSGTETDVCVLAAVLDAVDLGLRVVVAEDAICSSSDETHDAMRRFFHTRLHEQVEVADVATILAHWHAAPAS
jgi:nicotinamidase-related amidase